MENERPIEKLLRRFAKQRRENSGAPTKMHPATRRLLQGEVTRQFPKTGTEKRAATGLFAWFWPKWAYGFCIIAIVAVFGAMLLPSLTKSKSSAQLAKMKDLGQLEGDEVLRRREFTPPSVVPPQAVSVDRFDAPRLEEKEVSLAKVAQSPALPQQPPMDSTVAVSGGADSSGELKREFADRDRLNSSRQKQDVALFFNGGKLQTRSAVLNSFQVEQVGNELRVTDEDGSTYGGNIVPTDTGVQSRAQPDATVSGNYALGAPQEFVKDKKGSGGSNLDQSSQNYFFRVSGTNRTLQQQVVFEGNFITTNETLQYPAAAQSAQQGQNFQYLINNSVIVGKAQVEKGAEININATPVIR